MICIETRHAKAFLKARVNKSDRNNARGIAQMMRVNLFQPVHVKALTQPHRLNAPRAQHGYRSDLWRYTIALIPFGRVAPRWSLPSGAFSHGLLDFCEKSAPASVRTTPECFSRSHDAGSACRVELYRHVIANTQGHGCLRGSQTPARPISIRPHGDGSRCRQRSPAQVPRKRIIASILSSPRQALFAGRST